VSSTFEDLEVWKRGCRLAVSVYELLADCRDFGLRDQMQRSAVSVPSNIAEGYERTPKDFIRFLIIAKGSCAELRTQLYIATRINLMTTQQSDSLIDETKQISRMLQALISNRQQQLTKQ
jgi:four helix bundle protein